MPAAVQQGIVSCKCPSANPPGAVGKALTCSPSSCLLVLQQSPWGGRGGQHKALSGPRQGPGGWHGHHSPSMSRQGSGSFPSPQHSGFLVQAPSPGDSDPLPSAAALWLSGIRPPCPSQSGVTPSTAATLATCWHPVQASTLRCCWSRSPPLMPVRLPAVRHSPQAGTAEALQMDSNLRPVRILPAFATEAAASSHTC